MASVYEARAANARRIGEKLIGYLDRGFLVFNEEGQQVVRSDITFTGFSGGKGLCIQSTVFMDECRQSDNGMHTPITQFNEFFKDWKVVDPRHVKPLLAARTPAAG